MHKSFSFWVISFLTAWYPGVTIVISDLGRIGAVLPAMSSVFTTGEGSAWRTIIELKDRVSVLNGH